MFDIGFWELVVIAVVALLVVGPDRLPDLARDAGHWIGRLRKLADHARRDLQRELRWAGTEKEKYEQRLSELDKLMHNAPELDPDFKILESPGSEPGTGKGQRQDPGKG